jgi:hypothetical protein
MKYDCLESICMVQGGYNWRDFMNMVMNLGGGVRSVMLVQKTCNVIWFLKLLDLELENDAAAFNIRTFIPWFSLPRPDQDA